MFENYVSLEPRFQRAYDRLLEKFGVKNFSFTEAEEVLSDYANKKEVLSELEKAKLLQIKPSEEDKRKKVYRLVLIEEKVSTTKEELIRLLKNGADLIRTRVDYKVLLILLFFKAVSDKYLAKVNQYKSEGNSEEDSYVLANYDILKMYDVEKKKLYTWQALIDHTEFVNGLYALVELNSDALRNFKSLIDKTGLPTLFNSENAHIAEKLKNLFGMFDFSKIPYDALGDAYEWILYYFAPTKAKEGEIYTPIEVSRLLAELIEPQDGELILDPACGSASMLIEQFLYVYKQGIKEPYIELIGQEANDITAVLAELNFILHGIKNYKVFIGDSLINPKFEKADKVVANPPWNQDGYDEGTLKENSNHREIYRFGYTNKQSADWAWVQLINHFVKKKAAIVLDSGSLFRGGKEQQIRKVFVRFDLIDAIILLPEKIFYNTQAPGIIIVLNKKKPEERKNRILFINASQEYIQHPEVKKLNKLSDKNIKRIAKAYREYKDIEGFSSIVEERDIEKNDYNLNVSLYVTPNEEEEKINLEEEFKRLLELHKEYIEGYELVKGYLKDIKGLGG